MKWPGSDTVRVVLEDRINKKRIDRTKKRMSSA